MARPTKADLTARIVELEAQIAVLGTQHQVLRTPRDTAATVYLEGRPFYTALTHSTAFSMMRGLQKMGFRAQYKHGAH